MSRITITRQQESELPATVNFQFVNKNADYQQGSQQARRMATLSVQKTDISAAIVFDDTTARNIAEKLMYNVWTERDRFTFKLPRAYAYLEPTDVFTLVDTSTNIQFLMRIVKRTESRNGETEYECAADFAPVYLQNKVTTPAEVTPQLPPVSSETIAIFLDLPALRDKDATPGYYIAMAGKTATWAGGAIYQSVDGGATYNLFASSAITASIGSTVKALEDWTQTTEIDGIHNLFVVMDSGSLSTTNAQGLANGMNVAAIGSTNGWEIIQYEQAVLQTPVAPETRDTYLLKNLKRGLFGTEWMTGLHQALDRFVALDTTSITRAAITTAQLNTEFDYKILTAGQALGSAPVSTLTNHGEAIRPYSVVDINGSINNNDLTISWVRRLRVGEVATDPQLYDIDILDSTRTAIKRSYSNVAAPTIDYLAADQITDFGAVQYDLWFDIYQVSPTPNVSRSPVASAHLIFPSGSTGTGYIVQHAEAAIAADHSSAS